MITTKKIIVEARSWKGTPFHHQERVKGVGADCYGFVIAVLHSLELCMDHQIIGDYGVIPDGTMGKMLDQELIRIPLSEVGPGCVANFWWAKESQHLGFVTDRATVIHAQGNNRSGGVIETPVTGRHAVAFRRAYRIPGVDYG